MWFFSSKAKRLKKLEKKVKKLADEISRLERIRIGKDYVSNLTSEEIKSKIDKLEAKKRKYNQKLYLQINPA